VVGASQLTWTQETPAAATEYLIEPKGNSGIMLAKQTTKQHKNGRYQAQMRLVLHRYQPPSIRSQTLLLTLPVGRKHASPSQHCSSLQSSPPQELFADVEQTQEMDINV
jgi:hypothetical protein